jgi:hypothetical protein
LIDKALSAQARSDETASMIAVGPCPPEGTRLRHALRRPAVGGLGHLADGRRRRELLPLNATLRSFRSHRCCAFTCKIAIVVGVRSSLDFA